MTRLVRLSVSPETPTKRRAAVSGFEEFPGDVGLVPKGTKERLLT